MVDRARRHDIEDGELADTIRMIERHAVGDPSAAIVAGDAGSARSRGAAITSTWSRAIARLE